MNHTTFCNKGREIRVGAVWIIVIIITPVLKLGGSALKQLSVCPSVCLSSCVWVLSRRYLQNHTTFCNKGGEIRVGAVWRIVISAVLKLGGGALKELCPFVLPSVCPHVRALSGRYVLNQTTFCNKIIGHLSLTDLLTVKDLD